LRTALGTFRAWKAPITSTSEPFGKVEGCDYWRPALGAPLRFEMVATGPDGSRLSTVAVLRPRIPPPFGDAHTGPGWGWAWRLLC